MNNDAKFFFCLSGFIGFVLFFMLGIIITNDLLTALVQSSFGCLFFAVCGRILLSFILNGNIVDSNTNPIDPRDLSLSTENDPTNLATAAMNEASTTANRMVDAQV
ncbi:MAG: hypothetical protein P8P49_03965 [Opitutales bacterium]|nr:hypothetical protein [Opitutales bacterium]MDG1324900.1 hypothetical protein [Opitutales bacterium]